MAEKSAIVPTEKVEESHFKQPVDEAHIERADPYAVDLAANVEALIKNPLAGLSREALSRDVAEFASKHGLEHILPKLQIGAVVAQNPHEVETLTELDEVDREAILDEKRHRWRHPKSLYLTILVCSIGAAVQGWDQEGTNGANLDFPTAFGIGAAKGEPNFERDRWLVGTINAAPYAASALLGCWLADPLNNWFGRRGAIFISGIFCFFPVIGSALTQNWHQLLICRILLGIGMGCKGSTVPVFAAENSPAAIRGALTMTWQMWTAFGIFLGVTANLIVANIPKIAWRLQLGSAFIPAIPLLFLIFLTPESPRWLIKKGRVADAWKSLTRLRFTEVQAARDLYYIYAQLEVENRLVKKGTFFNRFVELFTVPRIRRATLASFTVMIAQQMCGINVIAFYSATVFAEAGISRMGALWASFGFGLINWLFAFPAFFTIDTFGRRSLLLFTFPNMAWSLLAAGFCFYIPESAGNTRLALIAVFIYIFAMFYSPGEGPVPFAYSAEVFPLSHREVGMAFAVATCLFWAAVLGITFPFMLASFGPQGAFGFYAGLNVVAFVMIFFWVPETKQRTLEELDYIFAVPVSQFGRYQTTKAAPHFIRRWILWDRTHKLEPLYHFDKGVDHDSADSSEVGSTHKANA
ncbi:hypothetical protein BKA62DRAFT_687681 [Auriculariales sp. MPI-PUGE-AT-0066]|nr:hypothetical protein BKA62DRAFT_687681 [Auriculariales sp. MPI-PUGE-AT-0066]